MDEHQWLAERFEENRGHLRGVAYRMLGSLSEADDAIQETWLRLSRTGAAGVENLGGWLTTVIARVCLDMLRARTSRREEGFDTSEGPSPTQVKEPVRRTDPEQEAVLADSVGLALLVVLEKLTPAERLAFVLHDTFDLSFDEIAPILGRSSEATRQLASRARRRVRGLRPGLRAGLAQQRETVDAFLAALRSGDFEALMAVLDPDLVVHADPGALPAAAAAARGAEAWARQALKLAQGARAARPVLVDGGIGVVIAPRGKLIRVLRFAMVEGRIAEIDVVSDPERLRALDLAVFDGA